MKTILVTQACLLNAIAAINLNSIMRRYPGVNSIASAGQKNLIKSVKEQKKLRMKKVIKLLLILSVPSSLCGVFTQTLARTS